MAKDYLTEDVPTIEDALQGARDIVAETISDDPAVRGETRDKALRFGGMTSAKTPQAEDPKQVYETYYEFDYRVDRILFREIIGTVTDAGYVRPHIDLALARSRVGDLIFGLAGVASFAVFTESTPGGKRPLGIEIDPTLRYRSPIGFEAALEQATFLPLAGMDNPAQGIDAGAAQLWRLRLIYGF